MESGKAVLWSLTASDGEKVSLARMPLLWSLKQVFDMGLFGSTEYDGFASGREDVVRKRALQEAGVLGETKHDQNAPSSFSNISHVAASVSAHPSPLPRLSSHPSLFPSVQPELLSDL